MWWLVRKGSSVEEERATTCANQKRKDEPALVSLRGEMCEPQKMHKRPYNAGASPLPNPVGVAQTSLRDYPTMDGALWSKPVGAQKAMCGRMCRNAREPGAQAPNRMVACADRVGDQGRVARCTNGHTSTMYGRLCIPRRTLRHPRFDRRGAVIAGFR